MATGWVLGIHEKDAVGVGRTFFFGGRRAVGAIVGGIIIGRLVVCGSDERGGIEIGGCVGGGFRWPGKEGGRVIIGASHRCLQIDEELREIELRLVAVATLSDDGGGVGARDITEPLEGPVGTEIALRRPDEGHEVQFAGFAPWRMLVDLCAGYRCDGSCRDAARVSSGRCWDVRIFVAFLHGMQFCDCDGRVAGYRRWVAGGGAGD